MEHGWFTTLPIQSKSLANQVADSYREDYEQVEIVPINGGYIVRYRRPNGADRLEDWEVYLDPNYI